MMMMMMQTLLGSREYCENYSIWFIIAGRVDKLKCSVSGLPEDEFYC